MELSMHFTCAFRFPPLSKKERKRREEIAKGHLGRWTITSDLPFNGILTIQWDGKKYFGSIALGDEDHAGETTEVKQLSLSGKNIAFCLSSNSINLGDLFFYGQFHEDTKQIAGKIRLHREVSWSGAKAH